MNTLKTIIFLILVCIALDTSSLQLPAHADKMWEHNSPDQTQPAGEMNNGQQNQNTGNVQGNDNSPDKIIQNGKINDNSTYDKSEGYKHRDYH